MKYKKIILKSSSIFDAVSDTPFSGSVIVEENKITKVIHGNAVEQEKNEETLVLDLGDKTLCPGFGDTHTFFTGYFINKPGVFEEMVDEIPEYLKDREKVKKAFCDYMHMLNSHGVTSVKEMSFDESYGFKEAVAELEQEGKLTLRVEFMSQPVKYPANVEYGIAMKQQYNSDFFAFSGFNQMTDGLIVAGEGDLLEPYEDSNSCCGKHIDYENLKEQVLAADREGLRFTLHSEGDGAFKKILDIYEECEKDAGGKLKNRHGITDLELTTEDDRKRMAHLGVYAEAYLQMLMTDKAENWKTDVIGKVGERFDQYLNMRGLADAGVTIAAATDLPFMIPDVPQSIYHGVYANAEVGSGKVNPQNALTLSEMLKAWTIGAQYGMGREEKLGTIEPGKYADLVVFDRNIFNTEEAEVLNTTVEITITNGEIVYRKEENYEREEI